MEENYDRWALWTPVALGVGIVAYFSSPEEPDTIISGFILICAGALVILFWKTPFKKAGMGAFLVALGFNVSILRTYIVNPFPLKTPTGPFVIEGTIASLEHLSPAPSLGYRVVLENLQYAKNLTSTPYSVLPQRARLTLKNIPDFLWTGDRLRLPMVLAPFKDTPSPNGYDFSRQAFFKGIGASGYALGPPQVFHSASRNTVSFFSYYLGFLEDIRHTITRVFLTQMAAPAGSVAVALVTGDTTSIPQAVRQNFADSGLAHLLAISGLHLSIVAGFFFFVTRGILAAIPFISLRFFIHKAAAIVSILGIFAYLGLSGGAVPVRRACIMTAIVMIGVLMDRQAITLRLVAVAATLILLATPEVLMGPSFQLSFSAVVALVGVYESWGAKFYQFFQKNHHGLKKFFFYLAGSLVSSLVATLATTPYTIFTFHRLTLQGLWANLIAIPLTSFLIMPCAVISCFFLLFDGQGLILPALNLSLVFLLHLTAEISTWPGAVVQIGPFHPFAAPFITFGGLWILLWKGPVRWGGMLLLVCGFFCFFIRKNPDIWVSPNGSVMGFVQQETNTLWVSASKNFVIKHWMQEGAFKSFKKMPYGKENKQWACDASSCFHKEKKILFAKNAHFSPWRNQAEVIISQAPFKPVSSTASLMIDSKKLKEFGAHTIWLHTPKPTVQTSRDTKGRRPWTQY